MQNPAHAKLHYFLDSIFQEFHQRRFLNSDPLQFVHRFKNPWDQEAVALLAALLAYGQVKQIQKSLEIAFTKINQLAKSPQSFVQKLHFLDFQRKSTKIFGDFIHRFNCGNDLILLFRLLNKSWSEFGSLGNHFNSLLHREDESIERALSHLITTWRNWIARESTLSFSYLLTSPQDGSCCKRWCMFLRWMGRKDSLDPGLWTKNSPILRESKSSSSFLSAHQLIMPLDTHTGRISQYLGLTPRKSLNWRAAMEVTQALKQLDPKDPIRFDFALSRLGILEICQKKYRQEICLKCQLLPVCQFAQHSLNMRSSSMPSQL